MKIKTVIIVLFAISFSCCDNEMVDNSELQQMTDQDQKDRLEEGDEPLTPRDDARRMRLFQLIAENKVRTPEDKFNAALILQHTGMEFIEGRLKSRSSENYYLAYQYSKSALADGYEKARRLVAVTYDRYSWMVFGFQKYGTQTIYEDGNPVWVKIDSTTTDAERAEYNIEPLADLLKKQPMQ